MTWESCYSLQVLDRIISGVEEFGFCNKGWIESPIKGAEGNKEFLACFHRIPISESHLEIETKEDTEAGMQIETNQNVL